MAAHTPPATPLGGVPLGDDHASFTVWAPRATRVEVVLGPPGDPGADTLERVVPLEPTSRDHHHGVVTDAAPGTLYRYRLHHADGNTIDRADPASRWQPQDVHGPSALDDPRVPWSDAGFAARPLHRQVIYELHVGTFSAEGTFDGVIGHLPRLAQLGITTIELLPVWQFSGGRNWGYDGVFAYAPSHAYGGPQGLRRLVDAAHANGLGVLLDVVYNHVGPEGNVLADYGPYFSDRYATPWGTSLNTDGPGADAVRRYVTENISRWVSEFHVDGFRLDAVHGIVDSSATHLLEAIGDAARTAGAALGKPVHVIAESDLADARLLRSPERGGYGLDAQWADDFHHAVHVALTGERDGYYADHLGLRDLIAQFRDRYVYAGRFSAFRGRTVGRPARDVPYDRYVVCVQNHDQVGNRARGERLAALTDLEGCKLAAAALLTSPFVPMLFQGEEHAETAPFLFFTSHQDPELIANVTRGRREEFASFTAWTGEIPDPQDPATFEASKLDHGLRGRGHHAMVYDLYGELLRLRREVSILADPDAPDMETTLVPGRETLLVRRRDDLDDVLIVLNAERDDVEAEVADAAGSWQVLLDTADERWSGPGASPPPSPAGDDALRVQVAAHAAMLLRRQEEP